jgi:hypothetical protein
MDADVFLVFVPLGIARAAIALIFLRRWEDQFCWERFRFSTAIWTTIVTLTVAGFVNLSDAPILLIVWMLLLLTPGGWLLFFARFPNFHGVDASASRLALADPSAVDPGP